MYHMYSCVVSYNQKYTTYLVSKRLKPTKQAAKDKNINLKHQYHNTKKHNLTSLTPWGAVTQMSITQVL